VDEVGDDGDGDQDQQDRADGRHQRRDGQADQDQQDRLDRPGLGLSGGEAAISFDNPRYLLVAACQPFIALFCLYRLFGWYRLAKRGQLAAHGDGSDTALTGTNQHESF